MSQDINRILNLVNEKWAVNQAELISEIAVLTERLERSEKELERLKKESKKDDEQAK